MVFQDNGSVKNFTLSFTFLQVLFACFFTNAYAEKSSHEENTYRHYIIDNQTSSYLTEKNNSVHLQSVIPGNNADTIPLGTAYHSKKQGFYGLQSIKGVEDETYGNSEAIIRVGIDMGFNEIVSMINGTVDIGVDVPAVKVNAGASYAKDTAADEYSASYMIFTSITPKKRVLLPESNAGYQATNAALNLANAFPGDLYNQVGDEFVSAIEYGSVLAVNMKLEFKNSQDKRDIGGYLSVDWVGKIKVSGELQLVDEDVKQSVKITIHAFQEGGTPNELTQIIPDGLMQCSLLAPEPCFEIFEESVRYMKGSYINQFATLDRYNVRKVMTSRYEDSGPDVQALVPIEYTDITFLSKMAKKYLDDAWIESLLNKRRAENILAYYSGELSDAEKQTMRDIVSNARYNAFVYADAVAFCDRNPVGNFCAEAENTARSNIRPYDKSSLNL